jgi:hypothetical protein
MSPSAAIKRGKAGVWLLAAVLSLTITVSGLAASSTTKPVITAEASTALAQMGQTLLGKQFSFQAAGSAAH